MTVSVVIPVYNVKPFLARCVRSVLNQTYKDLEIILVDDGSTDGSGELCDQMASDEPQIRVVHQKNQGLSGARNTGIREATGEYIIFLDSDDEWLLADGIEQLVCKGAKARPDIIMFKCVDVWKDKGLTCSGDYDIDHINTLSDGSSVFQYLVDTQQFRMSACFNMVRRELLTENDIFFPLGYISEDVYWSLHLWQYVRKVVATNLDFYGYYHHESSITTTPSLRVYESYDKIFSFWKEQCNSGCQNAAAIRVYLSNLWVSRGYAYYQLRKDDKPRALLILKQHADLLNYANTPKAKRTAKSVHLFGVKWTAMILGLYWRLRTILKRNAV